MICSSLTSTRPLDTHELSKHLAVHSVLCCWNFPKTLNLKHAHDTTRPGHKGVPKQRNGPRRATAMHHTLVTMCTWSIVIRSGTVATSRSLGAVEKTCSGFSGGSLSQSLRGSIAHRFTLSYLVAVV